MKGYKKKVGVSLSKNGASFRVWAPFADSVAIVGSFNNWSQSALSSEEDGYWSISLKGVKAGQEYKYVIRNGQTTYYRNDPRALHFPTSSGSSVIVSNDFDWGNDQFQAAPIEQQVLYEMHVGTFNRPDPSITGTFADACLKLDYLAKLGINMIELMPVGTMMMDRGWGYAIDYIFAVESLYGGRLGFMQFVKEAHKRGIGVILDVVYNHFGPDENMDLWRFDGWSENDKGGIYFYNDWRAETPWGNTRPDFGRLEVKQYILDNIKSWIHDCHVDGLRLDSTIYIRNVKGENNNPATDLPEGWYLLQQINDIARKIKPSVITIAEDIADNEYIVKPINEGGAGFTAQWELNFPAALRDVLKSSDPNQINLEPLTSQLTRQYNGSYFTRVIYMDSHDSSSSGASRLSEQIAPGKANELFARRQTLIASTITLTTPGIPMLFQGQETMEGGSFNDWQGLDWSKADKYSGIVKAHEHLIALRKNNHGNSAGLTGRGMNLIHFDDTNKVIAYHRWKDGGAGDDVVVITNFSNRLLKDYALNLPHNGTWKIRFNSSWSGYNSDSRKVAIGDVNVDNGEAVMLLPPSTSLILSQDSS